MVGNKVYLFIEEWCFEYEHETRITVFSEKQKAYDKLASTRECAIADAYSKHDEEDLEISDDDYDCFDIYLSGYAAHYEISLRVEEKKIR